MTVGNPQAAGPAGGREGGKVVAITANWKNYEDTVRCVAAIKASETSLSCHVIVVDNGSGDGSVEALRGAFPDIDVVALPENLGFARANNVGIRRALEQGADYVALVNNDAIVAPSALERGCSVLAADQSIGMLGAKILRESDGVIWFGGGSVKRILAGVRVYGHTERDVGQCDEPKDVSFITLAFAMLRADAIARVGLLPEEYFFGAEEWDYSVMVRRAGYRLRYEPAVVCVHKSDGSHRNSDPEYVYDGYRNKLIFQSKYLPRPVFALWKALFALYAGVVVPYRIPRFYEEGPSPAVARMCALQALRDHRRYGAWVEETHLREFRELVESARAGKTR